MIIIPAIDLKDGKCVRLYKGEEDTTHVVAENPVEVAKSFENKGAEFIHIVDLNGAFSGNQANLSIIEEVVKSVDVPIEVGGGIRSIEAIDNLISIGVKRVILGTSAINDSKLLKSAVDKYDEKIAVGIDAANEKVAIKGWVEVTEKNYIEFAKELESIGVKTFIVTDISKDGTLEGPNLDMLKALKENVASANIIASGGIKDLGHINELKKLDIYGAITGKAIYSGNLYLNEAIALTKN
ncbi:1-(5-phosphoribosyl)-5-[(5-phosphoribosylamino)methylideneamino]imidazole-4-carboxamide isomerase [Clostridium folliculivorans]|uniref:1-(5-phosphoribosyl)-5-[(5-phosphoribosylamino)methylideneamino] imidazole-4-carboxamide isomerase n=1 Tax=Clostridium folliculivorans TaxID=2886038 RepID=A0A9W5Y518_9CLOT|nr:1-(5-phosphoribosyl)-5-[(5-phosphoribosylamino)methylideneamino]imidazole-4-carboxamide isomerase [Clostridium folliculivorans]GKU26859.1 1-(5-phosphoribosyl)-5-[(5-phosphoribosylamino) methylideneamino] imidazole-4-carboxamide isomerase [Clostridium folliculivorans]GKU31510.1 1-(5-phosphoribosyl)-5-[(5-phosphoribosylamino) methylideneamino] imidazole-4-carboxamide isomerase [Clostridium folliculivorans]